MSRDWRPFELSHPVTHLARLSSIRIFDQYFGQHRDADVLFFEGEFHTDRKPGAMYFSSPHARDDFTKLVTVTMREPAPIGHVAQRVAYRMSDRAGGRPWRAVHLRRGDRK